MKESWFHKLPKRFQADETEVPEHLWDRIADGVFESKIRERFESHAEEPVPQALQEKVLKQFDIPAVPLAKTGSMQVIWTSAIGVAASVLLVFGAHALWNKTRRIEAPIALETANSQGNLSSDPAENTAKSVIDLRLSDKASSEPMGNIPQKKIDATLPLKYSKTQGLSTYVFGGNPTQNGKIPTNPEAGSRKDSMPDNPNFYGDLPQEWALVDAVSRELKRAHIYTDLEAVSYPLQGSAKPNLLKIPRSHVWQFAVWKQVLGPNFIKESGHGTVNFKPMQRQYGISARVGKRNGFNVGIGVFKSRSLYTANIEDVPFFKTPLRVNPNRKNIAVKSSYYNRELPGEAGVFVPNGFRTDDTLNFFRVNYSEYFELQGVEVPLYVGYAYARGPWRVFPTLGGRVLLPSKVNSEVVVEVLNPQKTRLALQNQHEVKSRLNLQPFAQLELQYQISPRWLLSANALLPLRKERVEDAGPDFRAQLGLCYEF